MNRILQKLCGCVMTLALGGGLVGCGMDSNAISGKTNVFTPALDTNTECSMNFAGSYSNFEALEEQFDKFREYYPGVSIIYTALDDYDANLETALQSEEAPDLFTGKTWMFTNPRTQQIFEYAEELSDPALGLNLDSIRSELLVRDQSGRLTVVPVLSNTYGILVNEDLFTDLNLAVPRTLAELETVCAKLRELGYPSPVIGYNEQKSMYEPLAMSFLYSRAAGDPEYAGLLKDADANLEAITRPVSEDVNAFIAKSGMDLAYCTSEVEDGYNSLIMRFFEGDIPMAVTVADTASGTKKRETQSESYLAHPFAYSFRPMPVSDDGMYLYSYSSLGFCVNRNSANLDMANEFMRYLINNQPLDEMAATKHLMTVTGDLSFDGTYATFDEVPAGNIIDVNAYEISDEAVNQIRKAVMQVANGNMTMDEVVEKNFQFED